MALAIDDFNSLLSGVYVDVKFEQQTPVIPRVVSIPLLIGTGDDFFSESASLQRGGIFKIRGYDITDQLIPGVDTYVLPYNPDVS